MTRQLFVDTAPLLYAVGGDHARRRACRQLLHGARIGEVELHASVEVVQEFLFHRLRRSARQDAVQAARDVSDLLVLHPFDRAVAEGMIGLVATGKVGERDAVHAATALSAGFDHIVSTDPDLDDVPGLRRVDPDELFAAHGA